MKKEDISKVISNIDDSFIEEAIVPHKKKAPVFKYAGIAACLAVAVISGILLSQSEFVTPPLISAEETTANESGGGKNTQEITPVPEIVTEPAIEIVTEAEMTISPKWDDRIISDKFPELILGETQYTSQRTEIAAENIGEFMADTEMTGYDIYEDKTYTINAKVYSIKNINSECAVAVKIGDENKYYVYTNAWYEPETLGDFISDLDLKNTVIFRKAYIDEYEYFDNGSEHKQRIYADFDDNVIWDMLSDVLNAKNVEYNHPYDRIGIETDLTILGYKNISFCVTPDGYIITNILNTQKCFFIGAEKFDAFDKYLKNNIPFKEYSNVYNFNPDGTIPGKGEEVTGQSTPGYNPDAPVQISPPYNPQTDSAPPKITAETKTPIPDDFIVEETTNISR